MVSTKENHHHPEWSRRSGDYPEQQIQPRFSKKLYYPNRHQTEVRSQIE
jgi:hypothetical protein